MTNGTIRAFWLALLCGLALSAQAPSGDDAGCLSCHGSKGFSSKEKSLYVNWNTYKGSVHGGNGCTSCHADLAGAAHPGDKAPEKVSCAGCHEKAQGTYDKSAHGLLVKAGSYAAGCADCHGVHDISPARDARSPVSRLNQMATCAKCHDDVVQDYSISTHGQAVAKGVSEAPTCIDCHHDHEIKDLRKDSPKQISEQVCNRCHASERLNSKFDMPANRVTTFEESYHGLAAKLGSTQAANCASCHGFHKVLPPSDPRSSIHPSNLVQTCAKCHPGAGERFVAGKIHQDPKETQGPGAKLNNWIRVIYVSMIWAVIGGMLAHNAIGWWRKAQKSRMDPDRTVVRMNLIARLQHAGLALSFIWLVISGFALVWPDSWLGWMVGSNENVRRISHRIAAVIMMAMGFVHLFFIFFTKDGRKFVRDMWPEKKDAWDVLRYIRHMMHPGKPGPRFGRFGYAEKAEYWAVVWGTIIMGATGLMLWFKVWITQWLPRWWVDIATTVHLYEAILATLAIIVWHFYFVIFDPDIYPINWAWLDGRVNREHHAHEHPLDVQEDANGTNEGTDKPSH